MKKVLIGSRRLGVETESSDFDYVVNMSELENSNIEFDIIGKQYSESNKEDGWGDHLKYVAEAKVNGTKINYLVYEDDFNIEIFNDLMKSMIIMNNYGKFDYSDKNTRVTIFRILSNTFLLGN